MSGRNLTGSTKVTQSPIKRGILSKFEFLTLSKTSDQDRNTPEQYYRTKEIESLSTTSRSYIIVFS